MNKNRRSTYSILIVFSLFWGCKEQTAALKEDTEQPLFELLGPEQTNISFQNTLTEALNTNILMYEYFYNGGGVASGDFNNDGMVDLYFTSNMGENKFYLNKGNMQFQDITAISGAGGRPGPWKTGVNAVDINADGKLVLTRVSNESILDISKLESGNYFIEIKTANETYLKQFIKQ